MCVILYRRCFTRCFTPFSVRFLYELKKPSSRERAPKICYDMLWYVMICYDMILIIIFIIFIIPLRLMFLLYMLFQSIRLLFQYFHIISILFQEVCNSHKPNFAHRSQWVRVHILCWKFALLGVLLLFVPVYTCCKLKWHAMYLTFLLLRLRMAVGSSMFVLRIDELFYNRTRIKSP